MAQKIASHIHENTPHKDRLVLVALVAILAFTVANVFMLTTSLVLASA